MQPVLYYLTFLAVAAVLVVLVLGILNMGRLPKSGDAAAPSGQGVPKDSVTNLSQQLMRWRVILQFAAILVIMLLLAVSR